MSEQGFPPAVPQMTSEEILEHCGITRDRLGQLARAVWIRWAQAQPDPKPSWLMPYAELSEADREADRMIGEALFCGGYRMRMWLPGRPS